MAPKSPTCISAATVEPGRTASKPRGLCLTPKNETRFPRYTPRSRRALGGPWLASERDHPEVVEHKMSGSRHRGHSVEPPTTLPPEGCFMIAGPASDPRRSHSVTLLSRSHSEEHDDSRGIGLATEPSSSTFPQPISAFRRTLHPASGRLPNPGELVGAPRLGVGVPKNASTKLGDTSKLTFAWRGYPARRSGTAHRRTTLPGFYPLRRFWYGKRPTSGLPHPTVLRLQAFSTS